MAWHLQPQGTLTPQMANTGSERTWAVHHMCTVQPQKSGVQGLSTSPRPTGSYPYTNVNAEPRSTCYARNSPTCGYFPSSNRSQECKQVFQAYDQASHRISVKEEESETKEKETWF